MRNTHTKNTCSAEKRSSASVDCADLELSDHGRVDVHDDVVALGAPVAEQRVRGGLGDLRRELLGQSLLQRLQFVERGGVRPRGRRQRQGSTARKARPKRGWSSH
eukprot:3937095-Rhodomonas_salina.1